MRHPRRHATSRVSRRAGLVPLAIALLVAACATDSSSPTPSNPAAASTSATSAPSASADAGSADTTIVRAYFVLGSFTDNAGLAPVLREVPKTSATARAAMTALLAGPNPTELAARPAMYTAIPDGTRLLDISISDHVATVNLSAADDDARATFRRGMAPAQVVYTLTQFPSVDAVRIQVDGRPLEATTRADHRRTALPAIFVDRPAWGAAIGNPARLTGNANVFEAQFVAQLRDADGQLLVERSIMATCGTGCWGRFATTLRYEVSEAQQGTLRVFSRSARDGSPENVTRYPVWLTPRQS